MTVFALVTEGITDSAVIEAILQSHFDDDDLEVRPIQPVRDVTDQARTAPGAFGGWEKVFEYCVLVMT